MALALPRELGEKIRHLDRERAAISFVATTSAGLVTACSLALLDDAIFLVIVAAAAVAFLVACGAARLIAAAQALR